MKPMLKLSVIIAISLTFTSCSYSIVRQDTKGKTENNEQSVQVQAPVKFPTIEETVNTLCSDEFQGRLIGSKGNEKAGKLDLKNKGNVSNKLYDAVKAIMKKDSIAFGTTGVRGTSDQRSFENVSIPNVFIVQENIESLVHKPTDTPDTLDYGQIDKIANAICDFVETNDGDMFN